MNAARSGAWLSFGYLARRTVAVWQDISPDELDVGLRVRLEGGERVGEIFLADTLANGAGYCSFLGQPDNFERFTKEMAALGEVWRDQVRHSCDSSCYECLRDYRNQSTHSLLDWQLAVDLLHVIVDGERPGSAWVAPAQRRAETFCSTFEGWEVGSAGRYPVCVNPDYRTALAIHHPFEEMRREWASEEVLDLFDEMERRGYPLAAPDSHIGLHPIAAFDLDRRPGWVEAQARSVGFSWY